MRCRVLKRLHFWQLKISAVLELTLRVSTQFQSVNETQVSSIVKFLQTICDGFQEIQLAFSYILLNARM